MALIDLEVSTLGDQASLVIQYDDISLRISEMAVINAAASRRKADFQFPGSSSKIDIPAVAGGRSGVVVTGPLQRLQRDGDGLLFFPGRLGLG